MQKRGINSPRFRRVTRLSFSRVVTSVIYGITEFISPVTLVRAQYARHWLMNIARNARGDPFRVTIVAERPNVCKLPCAALTRVRAHIT